MLQDTWRPDFIFRNFGPGQMSFQGPSGEPCRPGLRDRACAADDGLVPSFIRSFSQLAIRRLALTALSASAASLLVALLLGVAPARAMVVKEVGEPTVGLQPRSTTLHVGVGPEPKQFANSTGAPVLPANKTYAIYWDPTDNYHGDWQGVIDTFFQNMGASSGSLASVFAVDAQYTDAANQHADYASTFQGAYTDTDPYPLSGKCTDPHPLEGNNYPWDEPAAITCITNAQIETELKLFIVDHKLQTGMGTIFYLLTPPGVTVCLDEAGGYCSDYAGAPGSPSYDHSFCSYHSDINPGSPANGGPSTILYAAIPWIAGGLADGHINNEVSGYDCQDGGFDPSSKPIEEKEKAKERKIESNKEKEEHHKNPEEIQKQEENEIKAQILEGPHQQEPNQVTCPSPDGYCDTGLADLIINQIAVEQQNTVTNPLLNAWQDTAGNEATDECRNFFAPVLGGSVGANEETFAGTLFNQSLGAGSYYLNAAFNLASLKLPYPGIPCHTGISLEPKFTSPNLVNSGEIVGFDGMESYLTLNWGTIYSAGKPKPTYATYIWNFGDETPEVTGLAPGAPSLNSPETSPCELPWKAPCAASTFHSYQYGGTYEVTLTVIDTGGNKSTFTSPITVDGEPKPQPPSPSGPGGTPTVAPAAAGSSGSSSAPGSSGAGSTGKTFPGPVASQAAVTHSLSKALRSGLVISYSVNEQVAGQFQVLLASSVAKRIGLHGPPAIGLAPGSAPSIVIGKAILITTKGGRNTVKIQFGKKTAAKLRKLRRVSLTIRLVVRNASSHNPISTTVISTVTLSH
jgi:hypothetical protein